MSDGAHQDARQKRLSEKRWVEHMCLTTPRSYQPSQRYPHVHAPTVPCNACLHLAPCLKAEPSLAALQATIYPLELIRTRLAVSPKGTYRGMRDCVRKVLQHEGVRAFYKGLLPSLVSPLQSMKSFITAITCSGRRRVKQITQEPDLVMGPGAWQRHHV